MPKLHSHRAASTGREPSSSIDNAGGICTRASVRKDSWGRAIASTLDANDVGYERGSADGSCILQWSVWSCVGRSMDRCHDQMATVTARSRAERNRVCD